MGKAFIDIPDDPSIVYLGFVTDEDKYAGMKGAEIICLPSRFESFSISLLEGMAYGHPALVNGSCEVLRGHIEKSGGGCCYTDYRTFADGINRLLTYGQPARTDGASLKKRDLGELAREYVETHYNWAQIEEDMLDFILYNSGREVKSDKQIINI